MTTLFDTPEDNAIDPVSEAIRDNARSLAKMMGKAINWGPAVDLTPEAARDAGIEKVSRNEKTWTEEAHELILKYPHPTATGEDLRTWVEEKIGPPHHYNAFGAMVMGAIRKGLITNSGIYETGKRKESHARRNPRYIINR